MHYLQYPPRVILIIRDAAIAHPAVRRRRIEPHVVCIHWRPLAVLDEAADGSPALVGLLGGVVLPSSQVDEDASDDGDSHEDAGNRTAGDGGRVGARRGVGALVGSGSRSGRPGGDDGRRDGNRRGGSRVGR